MKNLVILMAICTLFAFSQTASAHSAFDKAFEAKYKVKASCNACHVAKKDKEFRNEFGKLYEKVLKGKDITKKWKAAKEEGSSARKAYEAGEMTTEFKKAMETVGKMRKGDSTYADLIKELKIEGLKAKS